MTHVRTSAAVGLLLGAAVTDGCSGTGSGSGGEGGTLPTGAVVESTMRRVNGRVRELSRTRKGVR
jgi:hypothetical protein